MQKGEQARLREVIEGLGERLNDRHLEGEDLPWRCRGIEIVVDLDGIGIDHRGTA